MKKPTYMKILAFACLLACSGGAVAQGYYEPIPYYGNDPFVFCTFGVPTDCWFPINPATGTRASAHTPLSPVGQVKSPREDVYHERKPARSRIS